LTTPDRISGIAAVKTQALVESGYVVDGLIVRKGSRLGLVTNAGRVEWYQANGYGAIDLEASQRHRRELEEVIQAHFVKHSAKKDSTPETHAE